MFKLYAYGLLTIGSGKLEAVVAIKNFHKIGLKEAKDWIDSLPHEIDNLTEEECEFYRSHFRCEVVDTSIPNPYMSNHNIQEPDEETKVALQWYEAQPKYIQEMIDTVGRWNNQPLIAVC
jgi:hypothetical protein